MSWHIREGSNLKASNLKDSFGPGTQNLKTSLSNQTIIWEEENRVKCVSTAEIINLLNFQNSLNKNCRNVDLWIKILLNKQIKKKII